jgi:hypothetical protein
VHAHRYEDVLWVVHASFQAHSRNDYITPLLVKAILRQAHDRPAANYDKMMEDAAALRTEFLEEVAYARTGRLSDPFESAKQVADWASGVATLSKKPLAIALAQAATLTLKGASGITLKITQLSERQQLEYKDLLYRSALEDTDATFTEALAAGRDDGKLAAVLNALTGPALDVRLDDSPQRIGEVSPAVVAALNSKALLLARSSQANAAALLADQVATIDSQTNESYALIKQIVSAQDDAAARAQLQADSERTERVRLLRVEAARATLFVAATLIAETDPEGARRMQVVGDSAIRAYESLRAYQQNVQLASGAGFSEVILMGNLLGVMMNVSSVLGPQQLSADELALQELNALKKMVADLFEMTSKRFDRLESIMESYQRMDMRAFNTIIVQGQVTHDQLDAVRSALASVGARVSATAKIVDADVRGIHETAFAGLQRRCYSDHSTLGGSVALSRAQFTDCLQRFANFAVSVARTPPFVDAAQHDLADGDLADYLGDEPLARIPYLLRMAKSLGSTEARDRAVAANVVVWSNATFAYLATMQEWPRLVTQADRERLGELVRFGVELQDAAASVLAARQDATHLKQNQDLFPSLLELYRRRLYALGEAAHALVMRYAAEHTGGVDPFEYSWVGPPVTPDDDEYFAGLLPSKVGQCDVSDRLPATIEMPPGITRLVRPEARVGARLDPVGHSLIFCYELKFSDLRMLHWTDKVFAGYGYFGKAWLIIHVRSKEPTDPDYVLRMALPDMFFAQSPTPFADSAKYQYVGEYPAGTLPGNFTLQHNMMDVGFPEWLGGNGLAGFAAAAEKGARFDGVDNLVSKGSDFRFGATDRYVRSRLFEERKLAAEMVENEFSKAGPLRDRLQELSGTKRLFRSLLELAMPMSLDNDIALRRASLVSLSVYDSDEEWRSVVGFANRSPQFEQYRSSWWRASEKTDPEGYTVPVPPTEADDTRANIEDLILLGIPANGGERLSAPRFVPGLAEGEAPKGLSNIQLNYEALVRAVFGAMYNGRDKPESLPVFTSTLGLARAALVKGSLPAAKPTAGAQRRVKKSAVSPQNPDSNLRH